MRMLQPAGWAPAKGYANGVMASGRLVFVAGQVGWNEAQRFEAEDFVGQARQALENIVAVLAEAGARPEHIARMTWYVTDKQEYLASLKALGAVYREVIGAHYPAMSAVAVAGAGRGGRAGRDRGDGGHPRSIGNLIEIKPAPVAFTGARRAGAP